MRDRQTWFQITAVVLIVTLASCASAGAAPLEQWGQHQPFGAGLEAWHLWSSERGFHMLRRAGVDDLSAALGVTAAGIAVELLEVAILDAQGVSVQDLAANSVGILAGWAGWESHLRYAAYSRPPASLKPWVRVPLCPVSGLSHAVELQIGHGTVGYRFRGEPADVTIGWTTMAVPARDRGPASVVPYLGYAGDRLSAAAGYDFARDVPIGSAGVRLAVCGLGLSVDLGLERGREPTIDVSGYLDF